jgi:hypothetical protein
MGRIVGVGSGAVAGVGFTAQASESDRYKLLSKEVHERLSFSTYEYIGVSEATNSSARRCILVISRGERSARHPTAIEIDCPREQSQRSYLLILVYYCFLVIRPSPTVFIQLARWLVLQESWLTVRGDLSPGPCLCSMES